MRGHDWTDERLAAMHLDGDAHSDETYEAIRAAGKTLSRWVLQDPS
jgi:hypothetical protein